MIEVTSLALPCRGAQVTRRVAVPPGDPFPGVVLCPDVETDPPGEEDPGWTGLADQLAGSLPAAVLLTEPGPGFSPAGVVAETRAAVKALRDDSRCDGRVAVAGFGLGAAWAVVAAAGETGVSGVVALGGVADLPRARFGTDGHLERLRAAGLADPPDPARWRREFISHSPVHHLAKLQGRPFLVVHGAADTSVARAEAEALAERGGGRLHVLPTAGRPLRRNPAAFETMVGFLREVFAP